MRVVYLYVHPSHTPNDRPLEKLPPPPPKQIIATGRRGERLSALQRELGGPSKVHTVQADVADIGAMRAAMEEAALPPAFRAVDVLVRVCMCIGGWGCGKHVARLGVMMTILTTDACIHSRKPPGRSTTPASAWGSAPRTSATSGTGCG